MNQLLAPYFILFLYLRQKSYFIHTVYMKGERDQTFEPISNWVKNKECTTGPNAHWVAQINYRMNLELKESEIILKK